MRKIILFLFLCLGIGVQKSLSQVRDTIVIHDTVYVEKPKKKPITVEIEQSDKDESDWSL